MARCKFTVVGRHGFPTDMLRYDACWPADTTSAQAIAASFTEPCPTGGYRVTLLTDNRNITPDRWRSFLWTMLDRHDREI